MTTEEVCRKQALSPEELAGRLSQRAREPYLGKKKGESGFDLVPSLSKAFKLGL
jgi:hypothetical protein